MWRATLKGLVAHRVRLALTALAVVLGVGFVAGTYMLTDTMNRAFDDLFQQINRGVAVDVRGVHQFTSNGPGGQNAGAPARVPATLLPTIAAIPGVRDVQGSIGGYAQLVDKQGKAISTGGAPTFGFNWIPDPELNAVSLSQGRAPRGAGEIAIDAATAMKYGFKIGDTAKVLLQGPPIQAEIVGIVKFGSSNNLLGATLVVFDPSIAQTALDGRGTFDDVLVAAANGVDPNELKNEVQKVLPAGYEALTGQESAQASSADIKKGLGFLNIALLVFAGISIFVGAFTIFNTFSILVAQRTRELALLRALGASASQVRRSVLAEAAVVGVFASAVGLAFGFVIAVGLQGLLGVFGIQLPSTRTQVLPRTIIVAFAVGIVTTIVASIGPALRASRVPPIAAIREAEPAAYRRSLRRTISGALVTLAGVGALLAALFGNVGGAKLVGLGTALVFLGVAILSPLMAGPLARIIGAPLPSISGVAGKLGRENAMRNPKRTASTAAALMIGLGLISFVSIFAASIKASAFQALEQTLKADYIVSTSTFSMGFSQDVAARLRMDPSFGGVEEFRLGVFGYKGQAQSLFGVDPATLTAVAEVPMQSGSLSALRDGDLLVFNQTAESNGWKLGDVVPVEFTRTGKQELRIVGIYTDNRLLKNYVVSLGTYEKNYTQQLDTFVLVKTAPGVTLAQAKRSVDRVAKSYPNVKLEDQAQFRQSQSNQINQVLGLITALLGLAIVIALFGIVNTLALSVFERTREIGLLRAVGMARRQVRTMIRWEAVIIAVFGAILGVAVGIFFGWAMIQALRDQGATILSLPTGQLVFTVVAAGIMGLIAAVLPARRAARLDVLQAIAQE